MNINSERIREKRISGPIQDELLKHSWEYRVLATLRYLFPDKYEKMLAADSPDLQDTSNSVGIEVVTAIKKHDMIADKLFAHYCTPRSPDEQKKNRERIEAMDFSIQGSSYGRLLQYPAGTSSCEELVFKNCIQQKSCKAQQYRHAFSTLGLAVLLPDMPTNEAESCFPSWIRQAINENGRAFDFVYVICERFCLYYDVATGKVRKKTIRDEETKSLQTIGRMTAEGQLSLSDPEWNQGWS